MIEIIPKIIGYTFFKHFHFPKLLPMNFTFSLLYTCNSKCKTCNVYKKKAENLSLQEYEKIFTNIGKAPYWVTLSGGEPFLRKDLADICYLLYQKCKPKIINIPTNGIKTDFICEQVKKIAEMCPKSRIVINLSIDGIGKMHDDIRRVPGNYEMVLATYHKLRALQYKNLAIGIHTVISNYNVDKFVFVANSLLALNPDSFITEIAEERVELDTIGEKITPNLLAYQSAVDFLIHRIKQQKFNGMNKITQAFRIEYYQMVKRILYLKKQVIPCYSGIASVHISPDGDVWSCCIKAKRMGNLREQSFKKIWWNKEFAAERKSIAKKECYCPLANASYTNMLMHFPTLFRVLVRLFYWKR
jgi:MoaA/NifB/PqqE/SkfB family radical SAM enzyme